MADDLRMGLVKLLRKAELEHDSDFLREGVQLLGQTLMELEVTQHVGAERTNGQRSGPASATAIASASGTRGWARSICRCHGYATAASIRLYWSRAAERNGPWWLSSRRRMSRASRRDESTIWCKRWGCEGLARARCPGCVRSSTRRWSDFERAGWMGHIRTSGSTPRSSRSATTAGWCHRRLSSPLACATAANEKCWAWMSVPAKTAPSGCSSCAAW